MDRSEFERLRDMPGKVIASDIRLARRVNLVARVADGILIANELQVPLRLNISFNPESGAKTVNVVIQGVGPICRLDVDGPRIVQPAAATSTRCRLRAVLDAISLSPSSIGQTSAESPSPRSSTSSADSRTSTTQEHSSHDLHATAQGRPRRVRAGPRG